ncbi:MAG: hypothetical protein Q9168_004858 [Polycauliona sp. 1 TL-2023]
MTNTPIGVRGTGKRLRVLEQYLVKHPNDTKIRQECDALSAQFEEKKAEKRVATKAAKALKPKPDPRPPTVSHAPGPSKREKGVVNAEKSLLESQKSEEAVQRRIDRLVILAQNHHGSHEDLMTIEADIQAATTLLGAEKFKSEEFQTRLAKKQAAVEEFRAKTLGRQQGEAASDANDDSGDDIDSDEWEYHPRGNEFAGFTIPGDTKFTLPTAGHVPAPLLSTPSLGEKRRLDDMAEDDLEAKIAALGAEEDLIAAAAEEADIVAKEAEKEAQEAEKKAKEAVKKAGAKRLELLRVRNERRALVLEMESCKKQKKPRLE